MADEPASPLAPEIVFDIRGPEPRGPLAERLLRSSRRGRAATSAASVVMIDGQGAGPDAVRQAVAAGVDQPLLLLHAGRQMRAALNLPIAFDGEGDAYLVLPGTAGGAPRILDFSLPEVARPHEGTVPPPDPEPAGTIPGPFFEPNLDTDIVADAVTRAITAFQRGEPVPRFGAPPDPDPPKNVKFYRYPSITKTTPISLPDPIYGNKYAKSQQGQIDVTYYFTGFNNVDANGNPQSKILVIQLAVGTAVALSGELITRAERAHLDQNRYIGWFQQFIVVGLNYRRDDLGLLLGTTPGTINRKITQRTTKGFSIDVGFEADPTGAKPKLGLNYKKEVSTTTSFEDWAVGEKTGPDPRVDVETVSWRYGIAYPFNSAVYTLLDSASPETNTFTPQSTSGFDFVAATALEFPPPICDAYVTFNAILTWRLTYLDRDSPTKRFPVFFMLGGPERTRIYVDLSKTPS